VGEKVGVPENSPIGEIIGEWLANGKGVEVDGNLGVFDVAGARVGVPKLMFERGDGYSVE